MTKVYGHNYCHSNRARYFSACPRATLAVLSAPKIALLARATTASLVIEMSTPNARTTVSRAKHGPLVDVVHGMARNGLRRSLGSQWKPDWNAPTSVFWMP